MSIRILSVLSLAAFSLSTFASVTGVLSGDGSVLTVEVQSEETFDPALVTSAVTNLFKTGPGTLVVSSDLSTWRGDITVRGGVYRATLPAAFGDVTSGQGGKVEVLDGATLELIGDGSRFTMPKKSFVIGGTGVGGRGAVVYGGSGAFDKASLGNDITLRSDALVAVEGNFHVYWNNSPTSIRMNGKVLTLKPYTSRNFILAYPSTPDPQGGRIVIDGKTLGLMNPDAALTGNGTISLNNSATMELSSLYGRLEWTVDVASGSALRTKAKIPGGEVTTNINVFGGAVALGGDATTLHFGYDSNPGGSVSFRGKVSGGGFSLTRDSRVTDAQFHLFNPGNDFGNGVTAAAGIDVYLWASGALPAAGGAVSLNAGRLFLDSLTRYDLPGAVFSGECSVVGGLGSWRGDVVKSGSGDLHYRSSVDGSRLVVNAGRACFDTVNRAKIAGLYEGRYAYRKNTRPDYTDFFNGRSFPTNAIAPGTMCSYDSGYALWSIPDVAGGDTRAAIAYKGYIWNNSSEPVNWGFAGSEGYSVHLEIGGETVYEQQYNISGTKYIGHEIATLQPGPNTFLYVVYVGGLTGGPNSWFSDSTMAANGNWRANFGLSVNRNGDTLDVRDYEPLIDPGDGSLFTYALPEAVAVTRPGVETPPDDRNGSLPNFAGMKFASGTGVDLGGIARYRLGTLEGLPAVTGLDELEVETEWKLDVGTFGGGAALTTGGALTLADGMRLSLARASGFRSVAPSGVYAIASAQEGVNLGAVSVVSDSGREFALNVSDDGKTLYLAAKPRGLVLMLR